MSYRDEVNIGMDDRLEDMICDIGEYYFRKAKCMILYVVTRKIRYIKDAQTLHIYCQRY